MIWTPESIQPQTVGEFIGLILYGVAIVTIVAGAVYAFCKFCKVCLEQAYTKV